jgi:glycosyltransferase involved in cell wall biosynthesis
VGRCWLILSYRTNIPGSAAAQHIDDRLPLLQQAGITPIILSGPVGQRVQGYRHYRAWSLAPSGIRFELRHFLRHRLQRRWQFKLVETLLLLPVYPFYLLEKILINLESEWSWFAGATLHGLWLQFRYRPEVLYSTGGSASAHVAALILKRCTAVPWIAETQDPLVHDHEWSRSRRVFRLYRWLENRIARHCDAFVFLTRQALDNARHRISHDFPGAVIYPGARIRQPEYRYTKDEYCRFAHFGSLAGSRNLLVFAHALHLLLQEQPDEGQRIRIDLYGSLDGASQKLIHQLQLEPLITYHGLVDRQEALGAMERADCLLLIQNTSYFSTETIPSKVYEYFLSGRPILGLIHHNEELAAMLRAQSHFVTPADNPLEVKNALSEVLALHGTTPFTWDHSAPPLYTIQQAVEQVLTLGTHQDGRPSAFEACPVFPRKPHK